MTKSMTDKSMNLKKGQPKSAWFLPEDEQYKELPGCGQIKQMKYPDTEQDIVSYQNDFVKKASKASPQPGFRH